MTLLASVWSISPWWTDSAPLSRQPTFVRLLLALGLGICVGTERQWRQRAAGLRTNTLVCLGAATFVDLGLTVAPKTTQVIAYVVSGVGFLGAGAIMKEGANIRGLNTAATLWCSAAIGACVGAGELLDGIFVALLLIVVNCALRPLSRYIDQRSLAATNPYVLSRVTIVCEPGRAKEAERDLRRAIADRPFVLRELRKDDGEDSDKSVLRAVLESQSRSRSSLQKVAGQLQECPSIQSVDISATHSDSE